MEENFYGVCLAWSVASHLGECGVLGSCGIQAVSLHVE